MKKKLQDFSIKDLKSISSIIEDFESIETLKNELSEIITEKEKYIEENEGKTLNEKFNIEMMRKYKIFNEHTDTVIRVLLDNDIFNIEDLLNTPTEKIKVADSYYVRREIEFAKKMYNMSSLEEKPKQKSKGKRK